MSNQYETLSPWAEADPIPTTPLAARLTDMADKTIGIFRNPKRATRPILTIIEDKFKRIYPTVEFKYLEFLLNDDISECEELAQYEEWLKGVDAVIFLYGD